MATKIDSIDLAIIDELSRDSKLTNAELSERVNLTPTPCLRRVKKLEHNGTIKRYSILVDHEALGLNISAFVFVKLEKNTKEIGNLFEADIKSLTNITEYYVVSGEHDYILKVVARDLADYERFMKEELANARGLNNLSSTIILSQPIKDRPLPITHSP